MAKPSKSFSTIFRFCVLKPAYVRGNIELMNRPMREYQHKYNIRDAFALPITIIVFGDCAYGALPLLN